MGIVQKLSWRANLLKKAFCSFRSADWKGVFREIFSSHSREHVYPKPLLLEKDGDFGLFQVADRKVWFPLAFDPSFLGFVYDEIFVQKVYEWGLCVICPGDWVVDAGACEGFFSLYALEKGANVLAFEPIPEIAKALEKTLEPFIVSGRAKVFPLGLGREQEEKTIYLSSINAGLNTMSEQFLNLHGKDAKMNSHKKVHITSLDSLLASGALLPISFIKADVEGYERELLLGAEETIRRFHPKLSICTYHLPDDWKVIPEIITSLCDSSRQNGSPESTWGGDMTLGMIKKRGHSEERSDEGISRKISGRKYKLKFSRLFDHVYGW